MTLNDLAKLHKKRDSHYVREVLEERRASPVIHQYIQQQQQRNIRGIFRSDTTATTTFDSTGNSWLVVNSNTF